MKDTDLYPGTANYKNIYEKFFYEFFTAKELGKSKHDFFVRHLFNKVHAYPGQMFEDGYPSYKTVLHCAEWLRVNNHHQYISEFCNAFGYIYKKNGGFLDKNYRDFINKKIKELKSTRHNNNSKGLDLFDDVTDDYKKFANSIKGSLKNKKGQKEKIDFINMISNMISIPKYNKEKSDTENDTTKITNKIIAQYFTEYENILSKNLSRYTMILNWNEFTVSFIKDNRIHKRQFVNRKLLFLLVFVFELNRKETEELFKMTDCFLDKEGKYLAEDKILWDLLPVLPHLKHLTVTMFAKKLSSFEEMEKENSLREWNSNK